MGLYRLYSGADGQSHIEELSSAAQPERAVADIAFREWPAGHFIDWHPAPRRQFIISIRGHIEIELGGGRIHRFNPGDARLVEDTTGQGHITRVPSGGGPALSAVIPLAE